ncbi:UNVERIFIED_CONTAM: hypothetical protein GTU68_028426 [Idotea baltica]|nr:hypothetical protein [Idotea baltica]
MKYHPDRNPDNAKAEEQFKEAKEAYEILSDDQKRAAYDQYGHAGVDPSMGGGGGFGGGGAGGFNDAFGGGGGRGGQQRANVYRGADLRYNMEVSLEQAAKGTETKIKIPVMSKCEPCNGSGAKSGKSASTCGTCGGHGQVRMQQGFFSVQQTCPKCHGTGKTIAKSDECTSCHGDGRTKQHKTLSVKIPAGVDEGDRIRLSGEGEAGVNGGPTGDLYVVIHLKQHEIFERDGGSLHCEMPVSFTTAALGGEIEVPTLGGSAKMKVPAETQTGAVFRLRGKGIKPLRSNEQGDLMVHVVVETPVKLTEKQKDLLKEFESSTQADAGKHSPRNKSWLDKAKAFFE